LAKRASGLRFALRALDQNGEVVMKLGSMSLLLAVLSLPACIVGEDTVYEDGVYPLPARGNGAPSGAHYNLNIIGVSKEKSPNLSGGSGGRIFVPLSGTTRINLGEGDFNVIDANATDGTGAFQLPDPDADGDGITSYSVFSRALGTPGGSSITQTCATDVTTGDLVCSTETMVLVRSSGGSKFTNVSRALLFVVADVNGDGTIDKVPLFDDRLQDFFWSYDNNGLRLAQVRFYELPTDTN
jgi:hypothetical protein